MNVLAVRDLSFSYGQQEVFHNLCLSVERGEVLCLMGPNGCGKTTLIDCIMAVDKPRNGEIFLMGKPLHQYRRHEIAQQIAYVPQTHDITFPYTVREMVLMGRTAYTGPFGKPSDEDEEICRQALRRVGMEQFADRPYSRLSGGEVKLVLLARALGQKTPLILMDEPTAFLDFRNELMFLETVVSLSREKHSSVLLATHSPDHAFYFASKGLPVNAAMLSRGEIRCCGRPEETVTSESILDVYGIRAKILTDTDQNGNTIRRVNLLETA